MWNIIGTLVLVAIGAIVAKKILSPRQVDFHIPSPNEDRFRIQHSNQHPGENIPTVKADSGFDLSRLNGFFLKLRVSLEEDSAFKHLLYAIEHSSFNEVVKAIDSKSNTPKDLAEIISSSNGIIDEDFDFSDSLGGPYISADELRKICIEESISPCENADNMVKNLIKLKINSGVDVFMQQFEYVFQKFLRKYNSGEDVSEDFMRIKSRFEKLAST